MKRKLILITLIVWQGIALGQSLRTDTLCLPLPVAKKLAFVKLEYVRLDSLTIKQKQLIKLMAESLATREQTIELLRTEVANLQAKNFLLNEKIKVYQKKEKLWKFNFGKKIKWLSIGVGVGAIATYIALHHP